MGYGSVKLWVATPGSHQPGQLGSCPRFTAEGAEDAEGEAR